MVALTHAIEGYTTCLLYTSKDDVVSKPHFAVSCQHYSFAVNAFVDVIREFDAYQYDFKIGRAHV